MNCIANQLAWFLQVNTVYSNDYSNIPHLFTSFCLNFVFKVVQTLKKKYVIERMKTRSRG